MACSLFRRFEVVENAFPLLPKLVRVTLRFSVTPAITRARPARTNMLTAITAGFPIAAERVPVALT